MIAWLVVEPLFQRQAIGDELDALEIRIASASLTMGAPSWNGLVANAEELQADAQVLARPCARGLT